MRGRTGGTLSDARRARSRTAKSQRRTALGFVHDRRQYIRRGRRRPEEAGVARRRRSDDVDRTGYGLWAGPRALRPDQTRKAMTAPKDGHPKHVARPDCRTNATRTPRARLGRPGRTRLVPRNISVSHDVGEACRMPFERCRAYGLSASPNVKAVEYVVRRGPTASLGSWRPASAGSTGDGPVQPRLTSPPAGGRLADACPSGGSSRVRLDDPSSYGAHASPLLKGASLDAGSSGHLTEARPSSHPLEAVR